MRVGSRLPPELVCACLAAAYAGRCEAELSIMSKIDIECILVIMGECEMWRSPCCRARNVMRQFTFMKSLLQNGQMSVVQMSAKVRCIARRSLARGRTWL